MSANRITDANNRVIQIHAEEVYQRVLSERNSLRAENARLRAALDLAGKRLSAVCALLETYPRMSQDPNGRALLDAQEIAKDSARQARAALAEGGE